MDPVLIVTARTLLRIPGARALVRRVERHPVAARLAHRLADRVLGGSGNYRLALQGSALIPDTACVDAVFALRKPARPAGSGPVVLVIDDLGAGGAQRQLVLTALGLTAAGQADVRVVCRSRFSDDPQRGGFFRGELARAGIPVTVLDPSPGDAPECRARLIAALGMPLAADAAALTSLLRRWEPAVVHAFLDWPNVAAGLAACLTGVPRVILSARNVSPPKLGLVHGALRPVYRRLLAQPNVTLTSNSVAGASDYAHWLDCAQERIAIIRNGFLPPTSRPDARACRARLELPADGYLVGGIFRNAAEKDSELWLAVASLVCASRPDVRFVWFGDGATDARMRQRVRKRGLDTAVVLRPPHRPVDEVYGAIDGLLSTSRFEGTPNVLIEAQWHGVPVVACAAGGVAETMEDGVTGRVVAERDAGRLAAAVCETLAWPGGTPDFRRRGRAWVEARFSNPAMVAATMRLYGLAGAVPQRIAAC